MKLGLRFQREDAPLLRFLAGRVRAGDMSGHGARVFEQAAVAAENASLLEVECGRPEEVAEMAALYVLHGVRQPVIEPLRTE